MKPHVARLFTVDEKPLPRTWDFLLAAPPLPSIESPDVVIRTDIAALMALCYASGRKGNIGKSKRHQDANNGKRDGSWGKVEKIEERLEVDRPWSYPSPNTINAACARWEPGEAPEGLAGRRNAETDLPMLLIRRERRVSQGYQGYTVRAMMGGRGIPELSPPARRCCDR